MEDDVKSPPSVFFMTNFQCRRCDACCRQPGFVYLASGETERLAGRLGMDVYDFTNRHCLLLERQHLVLKKQPDETCLFLGEEGCSIYDARPAQCREFPLVPILINFNEVEIGAILTTIHQKKIKVRIGWKTERSLDYCEGLKKN
jgi:Fe-S-cluster containining protein